MEPDRAPQGRDSVSVLKQSEPVAGRFQERKMKKLMVALLATSTMAFAVPALAHDYDDQAYAQDDWNNGGDSYGEFYQEYQHIWQGIQHGLSDGSYTPGQARGYYRAM